mmetsp:Transcript_20446/g.59738  ORF Transcript_20446/g.59738 Transcript_20446/m.59738 type:complete len:134 (+) Transcript_20446:839-1240(+)
MTACSPWSSLEDKDILYDQITTRPVRPPHFLSPEARRFIKDLTDHNWERRLGTLSKVQAAPYFGSLDWLALEEQKSKPPMPPQRPNWIEEEEANSSRDILFEYTEMALAPPRRKVDWCAGLPVCRNAPPVVQA